MALPVKASVWFVICGLSKNALDVLVTPIFTRILTKEQYGIFNVYLSWYLIVNIIFTFYLFGDVFNVGLVKYEKDRNRFISSSMGFVTTTVGVYLVLYLLFHDVIDRIVGLPWYLVILLFPHALVTVPYYFWLRRERYDYHYKNVIVITLLYVVLQPVMAMIAILCFDFPVNPGYTRVFVSVGIQIIIGLFLYAGIMWRGKAYFDKKYWKYSLKVGIELVPFNLSRIVLNQSDRLMINYFSGTGDTAIYSIAHSAAFALQAGTDALNGSIVPWLYRKMNCKEWTGIKNVMNGLVGLFAVCVAGVDIVAPEIMKILGSKEYYEGVYCIPALVYSVYIVFIGILFTNIEFFYGKNIYVTIVSSVGMVVNVVLNAIFIPKFGIIAAGFTTLFGYLVMAVGHYFLMINCLNSENVKANNLFDMKFISLISVVLFGFTIICHFIYQYTVIRWLFVLLLFIVMILTRNKWLGLIMNLRKDDKNNNHTIEYQK